MAEVRSKASHIKEANENLQYVPSERQMQPQNVKSTREELEERFKNGGMSYAEFEAAMNGLAQSEYGKEPTEKELDDMLNQRLKHR